jgi:CrcB protein
VELKHLLLAGAGSFFGGAARYAISQIPQLATASGFPYKTLTVNVIGSFVIGVIAAASFRNFITDDWKVFLAVGICGGFTTFSAFSIEMLEMLRSGQTFQAALYAAASVALGLLAAFIGFALIK